MPYPAPDLFPSPTLFPGTAANGTGTTPPPRGTWEGDSGDVYSQALRTSATIWYSVDAYRGDELIVEDLRPVGGSVTDTTKPGVRRLLGVEVVSDSDMTTQELFDELAPTGTELRVVSHVRYTDRSGLLIPMGRFGIDSESLAEGGGGGISLSAPDRWENVRRARFIHPKSSVRGRRVVDEIASLIRGALGGDTEVIDLSGSQAKVGTLTYERDRDQAILKLAADAGLWVFFDRDGIATIDRQPTGNGAPEWRADASANGVLIALDRERSRTQTRNVVVVESSASDGPAFKTQVVWDNNPASPTYAGTNPVTAPGSAGPFGIAPYFHDTPLPLTPFEARQTALTILARTTGLASQVSLEMVPNPKLDAGDLISVLPPRERRDRARVNEQHVADTVTHPLSVAGSLRIEGRSSRSDNYASEG